MTSHLTSENGAERPVTATRGRVGILAVLALYAGLLAIHIGQPWIGADAPSGALWSTVGRNIAHHGYVGTSFGQVANEIVPSSPAEFRFYQNHPPVLAFGVALMFRLAGEGEWQARLFPILFSMGSLFLLYVLVRDWYGEKSALLASFVFAVLPMSAFFGRHVNFEPIAIFFILAVVLLYQRWMAGSGRGRLALLSAVYAVAMLSDWPAYFLAGFLPVHHLLVRRRLGSSWIFPLISAVVLAVHLLHAYWLDPMALSRAFYFLLLWSGLQPQEALSGLPGELLKYSAFHYAWVIGNRMILLFTIPALMAACVGLWPLVREIRAGGPRRENALLVLALLLTALANNVLFFKSLYVHLFWSHYMVVPIAILAGLAAGWIEGGGGAAERVAVRRLLHPGVAFVALIIAVASLLNLKELHSMQQRLLPDRQHETADLVPRLAAFVRTGTDRGDLVVTNFICGPGLEAFVYYAGRHVQCGAMKGAEGGLKEQDVPQPGRRTVLLAWKGVVGKAHPPEAVDGFAKSVNIGGHWFAVGSLSNLNASVSHP